MKPKSSTIAMKMALGYLADGTLSLDQHGQIWRHYTNGPWHRRHLNVPRRAEFNTKKGYLTLVFYIPGSYGIGKRLTCRVQAHCLIWTWLHGPIPDGLQINHKDLVKSNNQPHNLELVTGAENIQHSYANGRIRPWTKAKEWRVGIPRITDDKIARLFALKMQGKTQREICASESISRTHLQRIFKQKGGAT